MLLPWAILAQDTSNLITLTLFPEKDPFSDSVPMHIGLEFDMRALILKKQRNEYQKALLSINQNDGIHLQDTIRIRARGEFRKKHCYFPPVKLNFKHSEFGETYLNNTSSLKLVTHCKNSSLYQQYLLKEYLIYRMFNLLTEKSYRVRLFEIEYTDSEGKKKPLSKYGFIIESSSLLAERLNALPIKRVGIKTWETDQYQANLLALFQFMIGNTDWLVNNLHNIRLFKVWDHNVLEPFAVPYDFDYSGMVNASYAVPPEELHIESVRQRVYRGYCLESEEAYRIYTGLFVEKKPDIYSLVENCILLEQKHREEMIAYLDEFYGIIKDQRLFKQQVIDTCREMPVR